MISFHNYRSLAIELPEKNVMFLLLFMFLLLLILFVVLTVLAFVDSEKKRKEQMENNDFNIRVYTYDYVRKKFYCFDQTNLTNVKNFNEKEFLAQFIRSDTFRITEWFQHLITDNMPAQSLQVEIKINKGKKSCASLLHFTSINRQKQIIHFESQLLPNLSTNKVGKKINSKIPSKYVLKTEEDCKRFLIGKDADFLPTILYFEFYHSKKELTPKDLKTIESAKAETMKPLAKYLNKRRKLYRISSNEFLLIDNSCLSRLMAMNVAYIMHTDIQQVLNGNSPGIDFSLAIGVTIGSMFRLNFALGKEQAKKMANAISQGQARGDKVLLYDENFFQTYKQSQIQKEEVSHLLKNGTFRLYFSPSVDIENRTQSFYLLRPSPYGTTIPDFDTVIRYAEEIKSGSEILFRKLYQKVLPLTKNKPVRIAIQIPYGSVKKFVKILSEVPSTISWILCLSATDMMTGNEDPASISRSFRDYRKKDFRIGIIIDTLSSSLRSKVLRQADYFFIPNNLAVNQSDPDQALNDQRSIQATYSLYRVPLVYYDLKRIEDVETSILNGGRIFECSEIAMPSSRLETIDKDLLDEIWEDADKLAPKKTPFELFDKSKNAFNNKEK